MMVSENASTYEVDRISFMAAASNHKTWAEDRGQDTTSDFAGDANTDLCREDAAHSLIISIQIPRDKSGCFVIMRLAPTVPIHLHPLQVEQVPFVGKRIDSITAATGMYLCLLQDP